MGRSRVLSFISTFGTPPKSTSTSSSPQPPPTSTAATSASSFAPPQSRPGGADVDYAPSSTVTPGGAPLTAGGFAAAQPPDPDSRSSSRPLSMIGGYQAPLMDVSEDTVPELAPIFTFLNSHSNKLYQEGYFLKLNDLDTQGRAFPDRSWTECFAQLVGTVLSLWDAAALDAAGQDGEVAPTFINLADASIKMIETLPTRNPGSQPLQNVLSISTAGRNRYLFHFSNVNALTRWTAGIRLSMFENSSLQEAYTGSLIAGKGRSLNNISVIMGQTKFRTEEWTRVRFGAGTPWRRCWCIITPPDEKEVQRIQKSMKKKSSYDRAMPILKGDVKFYDTKKIKKATPIATIKDAYSAYAIYPQSKPLIEQSTLLKIEGVITIHTNPETTTEGFVFVMPEVRPAVTGFEMLLRFLFPIWDVFALYGRPTRLVPDTLDTRSLMFAMPRERRYGYLEILDVAGLIHEGGSDAWSEREWKQRLKQLTSQRISKMSGSRSRASSAVGSKRSIRNSLSSRGPGALRFDDGEPMRSNPTLERPKAVQVQPHPDSAPPQGESRYQPPQQPPQPTRQRSGHQRSVSEATAQMNPRRARDQEYTPSRLSRESSRPRPSYEGERPPAPPQHNVAVAGPPPQPYPPYTAYQTPPQQRQGYYPQRYPGEHDGALQNRSSSESEGGRASSREQLGAPQAPVHSHAPSPVVEPPAFSHQPGAVPRARPAPAAGAELRRANSRMSVSTMSQLVAAGGFSSADGTTTAVPTTATAGAAAAWRNNNGSNSNGGHGYSGNNGEHRFRSRSQQRQVQYQQQQQQPEYGYNRGGRRSEEQARRGVNLDSGSHNEFAASPASRQRHGLDDHDDTRVQADDFGSQGVVLDGSSEGAEPASAPPVAGTTDAAGMALRPIPKTRLDRSISPASRASTLTQNSTAAIPAGSQGGPVPSRPASSPRNISPSISPAMSPALSPSRRPDLQQSSAASPTRPLSIIARKPVPGSIRKPSGALATEASDATPTQPPAASGPVPAPAPAVAPAAAATAAASATAAAATAAAATADPATDPTRTVSVSSSITGELPNTVDEDAIARVHSRVSADSYDTYRIDSPDSSHYTDSTTSPQYRSPTDLPPLIVEKPRAGKLKTVGAIEQPPAQKEVKIGDIKYTPEMHLDRINSEEASNDTGNAPGSSDILNIDFGVTQSFRPELSTAGSTSAEAGMHVRNRSGDSNRGRGLESASQQQQQQQQPQQQQYRGRVSPGHVIDAYNRSPNRSALATPEVGGSRAGSADAAENRRSVANTNTTVAWQPGVAIVGSGAGAFSGSKQGAITPEEFVQQRANANRIVPGGPPPGYAHARQHSGNINPPRGARTQTPPLLTPGIGGHSRKSSAGTPPALGSRQSSGEWGSRPNSRGASNALNPGRGSPHMPPQQQLHQGDYAQGLSAREQEHVAKVTGSPLLSSPMRGHHQQPQAGLGGPQQQPQQNYGLVGAIHAREEEKRAMKEGWSGAAVQAAIAQRQAQQQHQQQQQQAQQQQQMQHQMQHQMQMQAQQARYYNNNPNTPNYYYGAGSGGQPSPHMPVPGGFPDTPEIRSDGWMAQQQQQQPQQQQIGYGGGGQQQHNWMSQQQQYHQGGGGGGGQYGAYSPQPQPQPQPQQQQQYSGYFQQQPHQGGGSPGNQYYGSGGRR